jgi:uncharacterized membrane protein
MKVSWRSELPLLLLLAGMFVLAAVTWSTAPAQIPVHWGLNGDVDRYGGRLEGLLMPPSLAVFVYVLMLFLPMVDPGRANYARFAGAYYAIRVSVLAVIALIYGVIHLTIRGYPIDMPRTVGLLVGGIFFVLGNLLGKIRPNWFVGVRTPWTLSSKLSWTHTHRVAGWVFIVGGIVVMAAGIFQTRFAAWAAFVVMGGGIVGTVIYSYLVWRRDPDRVPPAGTLPTNDGA